MTSGKNTECIQRVNTDGSVLILFLIFNNNMPSIGLLEIVVLILYIINMSYMMKQVFKIINEKDIEEQ